MAEATKTPVAQISPEQVREMGMRNRRRSTPKWTYMDFERDQYVVEFPEFCPHPLDASGKPDTTKPGQPLKVSGNSLDEVEQLAMHTFTSTILAYRNAKIPMPWQTSNRQPPKDATTRDGIRTIGLSY